jgi:hypothetical protein
MESDVMPTSPGSRSMNRAIAAILLLIACLYGCAEGRLKGERDGLAGQPEPYKDGYVDGCSTGTKAAGNPYYAFKKDVARFESDKFYSQGWTDGFNICKANYESIGRAMIR